MAMEWVSSGKNTHFQRRQFYRFTVPVDHFPRFEDRIDKTGNRNCAAVAFVVTVVVNRRNRRRAGETTQNNAFTPRRACAVIVPAKTKATTWQANLPQHRRQNHNHPRPLFTVLHTLHAPASNNLRSVRRHLPRQPTNGFGINAGQFFSPCGIFRLTVFLTQQIRQELLKTYTVVSEEVFVVQVFTVQRIRQRQLQRHVSLRVNRNVLHMLASQILMGGCNNRIDANDLNFTGGDFRFQLRVIFINIVIRAPPVRLLVFQQIGAPQHNGFAVLQYQRPGGLLFIHFH